MKIAALLVLAAQAVWAQTAARVSGVVVDSATRLPLQYARVNSSNAA